VPVPSFSALETRYGVAGAREEFEHIIAQLVRIEHPGARNVRVSQGDGGIDVLVGLTTDEAKIWQAKFFFPSFTAEQRSQVKSSLAKAIATVHNHGGKMRQWTLCLPVDLTKEQEQWWGDLVDANIGFDMRLWGLTELSRRLQSSEGRDIYYASFEVERPDQDMRVSPPTTVAAADPFDLGVALAAGTDGLPSYIPRDIDRDLRRWLSDEPFVVLQGASASGKSRTLLEAARRCFPSHELIAPLPTALPAFVARLRRLRKIDFSAGLVLWLDDLDEFLGPGGLHPTIVQAVITDGVHIAATVRLERSYEIAQAGGRGAAVMKCAKVLRLESRASEAERDAFRARYRRDLDAAGIGEHFVAARRLEDRYLHVSDDALALTRMLIDWRRVTTARSLDKRRAEALFLRVRSLSLDAPLHEASADDHPRDAIVHTEHDTLSVPDYLVDFDDRRAKSGARQRDVPIEHWNAFLAIADPEEAASIADAALARDLPAIATEGLESARASQVSAVRAWALIELGRTRAASAPDEATEFWLEALTQQDADGVAQAADLLMEHADREGEQLEEDTIDRIREAIFESHDERRKADFAVILSRIYEHREDRETLRDFYRTATEANVAEIGLTYARTLYKAGDSDLSTEILEALLEHATEATRGKALVLLARLEVTQIEEDPSRAAEVVAKIVEAFDLAGDDIAADIMEVARGLEYRGVLADVLKQLADLGDVPARLHVLLSTPPDPEP
jgi:hypothetical protein